MFASSIPEIIELVGSGSKYGGELKREHGKRYIKREKRARKREREKDKSIHELFQSIQPRTVDVLKVDASPQITPHTPDPRPFYRD